VRLDAKQTGNITALQFQTGDIGMNALGNVLGTSGVQRVYDAYDSNAKSIFQLGGAAMCRRPRSIATAPTTWSNGETKWNDAAASRVLPWPSLYLATTQPRWWRRWQPRWPWVGPDLTLR
jgi:hypothetical protein